ncbi:aspartate--tRNA ligase dps1, partial [Marasmius crinis-equi]
MAPWPNTVHRPEVGEPTKSTSIHNLKIRHITHLHLIDEPSVPAPFTVYSDELSKNPQDTVHHIFDRTRLEHPPSHLSPAPTSITRCSSKSIPPNSKPVLPKPCPPYSPSSTLAENRKAFLAPGKQVFISGDLGRVYEVGLVFRAENSNTHRHMTEFTGLDLEMTLEEHYHEAIGMIDQVLKNIFKTVYERRRNEVQVVKSAYPSEDLPPHAGSGIGLERLTMLLLNLPDIRHASLFHRDPKSLPADPAPPLRHPECDTLHPPWDQSPEIQEPTVQEQVETLMPLEKLIANYGDASNTSWTDPRYLVWRHLKTGAAVGYVASKGYAIVVGDPLCDPKQYLEVIHAFLPWVRKEVGKPIWMLVSASVEGILGGGGVGEWKTLSCVAEDRTDTVDNRAKEDSTVQKKVRKAKKEGVRVLEFNGRERAALSSTTSSAVTSKMTSPMPSTTNLPSPEPKHPDQGELGPVPEDIRKKVDERMEEWVKERKDKGKQMHLTGLDPWRDWEHRMYFIGTTTDKESGETKVHALVVLTQLAPQHGWQVKWALDFNGAPSGTIEHTVLTALDAAASSGATSVTFGAGATASLSTNHGFSHRNLFVKSLEHLYQVLATEFKLFGKSEFRAKMGAVEDPVY